LLFLCLVFIVFICLIMFRFIVFFLLSFVPSPHCYVLLLLLGFSLFCIVACCYHALLLLVDSSLLGVVVLIAMCYYHSLALGCHALLLLPSSLLHTSAIPPNISLTCCFLGSSLLCSIVAPFCPCGLVASIWYYLLALLLCR